ncbi:MAG: hypothetical protein ACI9BC_000039 [Crocinitomicaceae bacterium]|jgi:hypothetical protein
MFCTAHIFLVNGLLRCDGIFVFVSQRGIPRTQLVREARVEIRRKKKTSPYGLAFFYF